jgi:hypothetical protein
MALLPSVHAMWYTEGMEAMKNKPGLVRRNGTYYARVRVPKHLVDQLGKAEITQSLRTKDRATANAALPPL